MKKKINHIYVEKSLKSKVHGSPDL